MAFPTFAVSGDLTLLDLVLVVQELTGSEQETVAAISALLDAGHVRLRSPSQVDAIRLAREIVDASARPARA